MTKDNTPAISDKSPKGKAGRPFLTPEQRELSIQRRKEYLENYHAKRKKPRNFEYFFSFTKAQEVVQKEGIFSRSQYREWYKRNRPSRMPRNPDIFYKHRGYWKDWNHFLGVHNVWPYVPKGAWRSYSEARAFVMSRRFKNRAEWIEFCRSGDCPDDIPFVPDRVYAKTREWISWREFLGPQCAIEYDNIMREINPAILFILRIPDRTNHSLYRIGVTVGGQTAIMDAIEKNNLTFVDAFIIEDTFDWRSHAAHYGEQDWQSSGVYSMSNISEFIFFLSQHFSSFKLGKRPTVNY